MESAPRTLGLGLDTGGTYTDAAVVDMSTLRVLAKAKSPTTYHNLSIGITGAMDGVLESKTFSPEEISFVGLSTTLATNSILQGKGGKVGLIGIGWTPLEEWNLGADLTAFITGGHGVYAEEQSSLDLVALKAAVDDMKDVVDAFVVSSLFSVYNPSHEKKAREFIRKETGMPVVVGHELSPELGINERTVTAVLNARLLPIIDDFLTRVETTLRERGIIANILVFKGDGTLMNLEMARERPVETILSGPAASLMGGKVLAGEENCIVVDIGGTSTDIAYLDDGFPRISKEGATIGMWRTRVRAIDIWTVGLGGDSLVTSDQRGSFTIGPQRVLPLCEAALLDPSLKKKMMAIGEVNFYLTVERDVTKLDKREKEVYQFLADAPMSSMEEIRRGCPEVYTYRDIVARLRGRGFIQQVGITPTDFLHISGAYVHGDVEASRIAIGIAATASHMEFDMYNSEFMREMVTRMGEELIKKVAMDEAGEVPENGGFRYLVRSSVRGHADTSLHMTARLDRTVIGIGAPAHVYTPSLEERMDVRVVVPQNHDVGNAVGAVCSQISETISVQVYPDKDHRFHVFSSIFEPMSYGMIDTALSSARRLAEEYVRNRVFEAGAKNIKVRVDVNAKKFFGGDNVEGEQTAWIDVVARAIGEPKSLKDMEEAGKQKKQTERRLAGTKY